MGWMPHSLVKSHILRELDRLNKDKEGQLAFQKALAYLPATGGGRTLDSIFRPTDGPDAYEHGLQGMPVTEADGAIKPLDFNQDNVNHTKIHWFTKSRDSDENRKWDGPQANKIILYGLKEAVQIALDADKPLNITWACPGRADPDPEILVIKSDFQVTTLVITPRRWWRLTQLSSQVRQTFKDDQPSDYEILFEYGDEDKPVDGPVMRKVISQIPV